MYLLIRACLLYNSFVIFKIWCLLELKYVYVVIYISFVYIFFHLFLKILMSLSHFHLWNINFSKHRLCVHFFNYSPIMPSLMIHTWALNLCFKMTMVAILYLLLSVTCFQVIELLAMYLKELETWRNLKQVSSNYRIITIIIHNNVF